MRSCTCDLSWKAISGLAAPKVIRTTIDDSPSSLIITSHLPPFQSGLACRMASSCLRIAGSEASKDKTNEKEVSDSAEVRVQLVKGLSRKYVTGRIKRRRSRNLTETKLKVI